MRITKRMAVLGFNLSASIFIGLCVYGILIYFEGEGGPPRSLASAGACAVGVLASIVGVCYFGSQWDRRNAEEARKQAEISAPPRKSVRR
ncbi:MAG: hypothetical protein ACM3NF_08100 [Gemmatimonadota bacterium]